jgi:hypothetical protein
MYYPLGTVSTPSAFSLLKQQLLAKADWIDGRLTQPNGTNLLNVTAETI